MMGMKKRKSKKEKANTAKLDWWDIISNEEKGLFEEGLKDMKKGKVKKHEEVMGKYRESIKK
jgi:predicted transcriptional regulator